MQRQIKKQENGSIMLEVVAVLALMGVMGAMLFRQIYQRNQELHNIQMASEIRTVKEAFSAYIQANRAAILSSCALPTGDNVVACNTPPTITEDQYALVADYLPDGWFTGEELEDAYTLTLWNYNQGDDTRRVVYGIVVPTAGTLPSTGWNFRRAARVALLVGADGGAYDATITSGDIAGSLGSWQINPTGTGADTVGQAVYVATTGIDIFAPEYEAGEGSVNLPTIWDLALDKLHAYNYFSVGNSKVGACYVIHHHETRDEGGVQTVRSDDITIENNENCRPLFWVGSESGGPGGTTGNVYVATDLNIGQVGTDNKHDSALKLTAEGVIQQKDGLTIDKDGRVVAKEKVSAAIGDLAEGEHFVLDPAYTSTMNDIRLASRGGVRLSDILPNYILKEQMTLARASGKQITLPTCPPGYKKSLAIIPTSWDKDTLTVDIPALTVEESSTNQKEDIPVKGGTAVDIPELTVNESSTVGQNDVEVKGSKGVCVTVDTVQKALDEKEAGNTERWGVTLGVKDGENCHYNQFITAIAQTYCVWEPSLYNGNENKCKAAGYEYTSGKCTTTHVVDGAMGGSVVGAERSKDACEAAGFTWDTNRCKYIYSLTNINAITDLTKKAGACKAAGFKWNGTECSNS